MSRVDELIKEKCPDGVKYKTLGETCEIKTGAGITKKDATKDGPYPIISGGIEPLGMYDRSNRKANTVTIARAGGAGYVNYIKTDFYLNDKCFSIIPAGEYSNSIDSRFLYFVLKNMEKDIMDMKSTGSVPTVNTQKVAKIKIPVPPLEIQQEIVGMLNSFTELEAELEAELTKRKQQYEHYRDHLLSFENIAGEGGQVEQFALGDIATVTKLAGFEFTKYVTYSNSGNVIALRGLNVKNGQLDLKDVKYIDKSDLSKLNRSKLVIGDMLFTYVGTVGQVALISENEKYYLAPNVSMIRLNDKNAIMPKYLMYYFQTNTFRSSQIDRLLQASSMQNIPMEKIRKFNIPVPSKKIQERIVYVLDNFDSVCNDLKIGLPAEIEARQKQYEYYRDRLLSFDAVVGGGTEREE